MAAKTIRISSQTRQNWVIDAAVFAGAVLASITGIYFLFLPSGGYQGGRNPAYGITILFARETWADIHIWGGILMLLAVALHLTIHWSWVKMMTRRLVGAARGQGSHFSRGARINLMVNLAIAISFLLTAISGVVFLFTPTGGFQGGRNPGWDPYFLISRTSWDLVHTWSGTVMIIAAILHFAIHWRWVVNVTRRLFLSLWQRPRLRERLSS